MKLRLVTTLVLTVSLHAHAGTKTTSAVPDGDPSKSQVYCSYWLRHLDGLAEVEERIDAVRKSGVRAMIHRQYLRAVFKRRLLRADWDAFGELVDAEERLFPPIPPTDDDGTWFNGTPRILP